MESNTQINESIVLERYQNAINYYWSASRHNKKSFKTSRFAVIILGSLVTLMSSFSSAAFIEENISLKVLFAVITPLLAALMTIIGGIAQSFHWGAAWRDMVLNAQRLEKARDIFLATEHGKKDLIFELKNMHNLVIKETKGFFQRVVESAIKPKDDNEVNEEP